MAILSNVGLLFIAGFFLLVFSVAGFAAGEDFRIVKTDFKSQMNVADANPVLVTVRNVGTALGTIHSEIECFDNGVPVWSSPFAPDLPLDKGLDADQSLDIPANSFSDGVIYSCTIETGVGGTVQDSKTIFVNAFASKSTPVPELDFGFVWLVVVGVLAVILFSGKE